jgi:hypothetical protein
LRETQRSEASLSLKEAAEIILANGELSMDILKEGTVCSTHGGDTKCYYIPQFGPPRLENSSTDSEGGEHYTELFLDASVVQSFHRATRYISDRETRAELEKGIAAAVKAMEKRGSAETIKITLGD